MRNKDENNLSSFITKKRDKKKEKKQFSCENNSKISPFSKHTVIA